MGDSRSTSELCSELEKRAAGAGLLVPFRRERYEPGDVLDLTFRAVRPDWAGHGRFRVEMFAGSGFAGQVYRCRVESVDIPQGFESDLREGMVCAVKILKPASSFARFFRDVLYRAGFQAAFSAAVNESACRAGLLWQKAIRLAAGIELGRQDAVADVYASFFDDNMCAWGEIREWVEGRLWRLEADDSPGLRRKWRTIDPRLTGSPEYVAKRRFMDRLVRLIRDMGAWELSRQYVWWTMKSQPNVLKREGFDADPEAGLCAVDFRAGLVLLPFLPMSPADIGLVLHGLRRGAVVQFDRGDVPALRRWMDANAAGNGEMEALVRAIEVEEDRYRRSIPDVWNRGWSLVRDPGRWRAIRGASAEAHRVCGDVDGEHAARLARCPGRWIAFWAVTAVPFAGRWARRFWGNAQWRAHVVRCVGSFRYFLACSRVNLLRVVVRWVRAGRVGEGHARLLAEKPALYWLERCTLGLLPAGLHRAMAEPSWWWSGVTEWFVFVRRFCSEAGFREEWLRNEIDRGHRAGMLTEAERRAVLGQVGDPYIARYLKSLGVHLATLPVSEIFWGILFLCALAWFLWSGVPFEEARKRVGVVMLVVIAVPVSPGSLVRGIYVLYLMARDRSLRDYVVAAPVSFVKIIGYLAFPIQMATSYPVLARFMAAQWATKAVNSVPVFGEKGGLLEHQVFDMFFNLPRALGRRAAPHLKGFLDAWLLLGIVLFAVAWWAGLLAWPGKRWVEAATAVVCVFVLPRTLFYPVMRRRSSRS
jgi:hypothetical protein